MDHFAALMVSKRLHEDPLRAIASIAHGSSLQFQWLGNLRAVDNSLRVRYSKFVDYRGSITSKSVNANSLGYQTSQEALGHCF